MEDKKICADLGSSGAANSQPLLLQVVFILEGDQGVVEAGLCPRQTLRGTPLAHAAARRGAPEGLQYGLRRSSIQGVDRFVRLNVLSFRGGNEGG
jgi:hypothetical protein